MINNFSTTSQPLNLLARKSHKIQLNSLNCITILNENVITQTSLKCLLYSIDMVSSSLWGFHPNCFASTQISWKIGFISGTELMPIPTSVL